MNSPINGVIQANLECFIDSVAFSNVFKAMDEHGISIPWLSKQENEPYWNYLVVNLEFPAVAILSRMIDTYRATGEYPRFGIGVDGLMG